MNYRIRPLQAEDVDVFLAVRLEALQNSPTAFGMDYEETLAQPNSYWRGRIAPTDDRVTFAADAGGLLIGMAGIFRESHRKQRHSGYIWGVYVQPAWRGQRIVDSLLNACLDWARERDLRLVRLGVNATNAPAIRAYTRLGFSVYGVEPDVLFWENRYYDELLLYKRLTLTT